jgi:phosphoglycerate dehydrogenase-like enzyme
VLRLGILAEDAFLRAERNRKIYAENYEVHDLGGWRKLSREELLAACRSVHVVLLGRRSPRLPEELAENFGRLEYACHLFGTIRHLISKELIEAGLKVTNWGDEVKGVAEGAMALLLCQLKQLPNLDTFTKGGPNHCIRMDYPATLRGRDVGLYGYGPIGRHMADLLQPFEARIAIYDPYAEQVPDWIRVCETLEGLFETCQIVSIHCGLNETTRGSVTRELLERLPQGGVVVNTARGKIVDERALAELVSDGRLLAGIDVIHNERRWPESPLATEEGAVLTRHWVSGGYRGIRGTRKRNRYNRAVPGFVVRNLAAFARGEPLIYEVTADIYDLKT